MAKLTKRTVDAAVPKEKPYLNFDDEVRGFALRVHPTGEKTFVMRYRFGGADRKMRLGRHGDITPDEARRLALKARVTLADGLDPGATRRKLAASPTLKDLSERFLREHVDVHCKPCTAGDYRHTLNVVAARLARRRIAEITRADIAELHQSLSRKPYLANRTLTVLSKMFNLAEVWGLRPDGSNPCRHVKKYREVKRERYLSAEELSRLGKALDTATRRVPDGSGNYVEGPESPHIIAAYKLLILTGCRLGEIQTLKWDHVREDRLELPDSKTGAKTVPLGREAVILLHSIPRVSGNQYVIVGEVERQYATDLQRPWQRIRKLAGLEDVRIHDLRHTFASFAVAQGESLPMIGKLLGHTQAQTTLRYAHLARAPLTAAASRVTAELSTALGVTVPTEARLLRIA
jgi:integrase